MLVLLGAICAMTLISAWVAWYGTKHGWRGNDPPWRQRRKRD